MPEITVTENIDALSLKDYLRRYCGISLSLWRKIKRGKVAINDEKIAVPALAKISTGDKICWAVAEKSAIIPEEIPLDIIFEDEFLLAVNKPWGQLVHPTVSENSHTLANAVMRHYEKTGGARAFHPIHRLDKNTSGLLLIAKEIHVQNLFTFSDAKKNLCRRYLALVQGAPQPALGTIDAPIGRKDGSIIERTVRADGKRAVTKYRTLQKFDGYSLVELFLLTGRTHQIRVHMAHIGCPLLGDDLYGGEKILICRQALHAAELEFIHPITCKHIKLTAPLPLDIAALLKSDVSR